MCKLQSPFLLYLRIYVAWVFLKSGMHKIGDWETTLYLFEYEYAVPLLPLRTGRLSGHLRRTGVPDVPDCRFRHAFLRLALTAVNIMAVVSYYATLAKGAGLVWHYLWAAMLFTNVIYGGGFFSVDHWLKAKFGQSRDHFTEAQPAGYLSQALILRVRPG